MPAQRVRAMVKPMLEMLAGIPTVVYGFFAALTVGAAPARRRRGARPRASPRKARWPPALVMGIMIIPFVSSLSDDVINAVPQSLRDGSYALGATKSETIRQVVLPAALPGIVGAVLLAVSPRHRRDHDRGDGRRPCRQPDRQSAGSRDHGDGADRHPAGRRPGVRQPKTLAAFALGLVLFVVTLVLNIIALSIVRKYREQYD